MPDPTPPTSAILATRWLPIALALQFFGHPQAFWLVAKHLSDHENQEAGVLFLLLWSVAPFGVSLPGRNQALQLANQDLKKSYTLRTIMQAVAVGIYSLGVVLSDDSATLT